MLLPPPAAARAMPLLPAVASGPAAFSARPTPSDPEGAPPWATFAPPATCPEPEAAPAIAPPPEAAPTSASAPSAGSASARTPRAPVGPPPPPPPPSSGRPVPASPPADSRPEVGIVAYVNAFCPHCRVTHRRLGRVLAALGVTARVRRVYTWPGDEVPAWARACAHAQTLGLEDRFFDELAAAESDDLAEILAAGRRAGLDAGALRTAIATGGVAPRLERDLRIAGSAGLEGLPTLDIGRRRLLGEQSEGELREAIVAALALRRDAR